MGKKKKSVTETTLEETTMNNTVQTVQTDGPKKPPYAEIAVDDGGDWHFVIWSGTGRKMCVSAVAYPQRKAVIAAVKSLIECSANVKKIVISHPK